MRSFLRAASTAAIAAVVLVTVVVAPAPAGASPIEHHGVTSRTQDWGTAEEQAFVDKINQLRSSLGLATLAVDPELTAQARIWSQTMKDAGNIFHTTHLDAGITSDWEKLGENVGVGGTVDALFDAFVASPKHYENLVDPSYRFIGVGVVWDGTRMFTAHRFMALLPPAASTTAPAEAPRPAGTRAGSKPATPTTTTPAELDATEPTPTSTPDVPPPPPAPVVPPATPERVSLILSTIDDLLS